MSILIKNIGGLVNCRTEYHLLRGKELSSLPTLSNAYLIINAGIIEAYGEMSNFQKKFLVVGCW